jgi:hypothetical protein
MNKKVMPPVAPLQFGVEVLWGGQWIKPYGYRQSLKDSRVIVATVMNRRGRRVEVEFRNRDRTYTNRERVAWRELTKQ